MTSINMRWAIAHALREEMERDERVFIAGEDVEAGGIFGLTRGLCEQFGEWRVKDTPISEEAICGLAIGAAAAGMRPVVEIMFDDFITIGMDQLCNQAAKMRYFYGEDFKLPFVVRTMCGAGTGAGAHHSQSLEAWFIHTPGLKVVMPSNAYDAKGLLKSSIRDDNPVIFMEQKTLYPLKSEIPDGEYLIPLGQAEVKRTGSEVTVVATGKMVHTALAAAEKLVGEGIEVEVVDPRTLSPLDEETILASVAKTGRLVVVHEAPKPCGFGAEVAAIVAEKALDYLEAPIKRVTPPFIPVPFGPSESYYIPEDEDIIQAIRETLG